MKKILFAVILLFVFSMSVTVNAATTSAIKINNKDGSLYLDIKSDAALTDTTIYTAMYFEGKLIGIVKSDLRDSTSCLTKFDFGITPDKARTYYWKNNLMPLSGADDLTSADALKETNKNIVLNLNAILAELKKVIWKGYEKVIISNLTECANDALKFETNQIMSPEFAQRYYNTQLKNAKDIYDNFSKEEKSAFQSRIFDMDPDITGYFIDYFGLKSWL